MERKARYNKLERDFFVPHKLRQESVNPIEGR